MFKKLTIFWAPALVQILAGMTPPQQWRCLGAQRINALPAELWDLYMRVPQNENPLAEWLEGKCFEKFTAERGWLTDWLQIAERVEIHVWPFSETYWRLTITCHYIKDEQKKKNMVDCMVDIMKGTIAEQAMHM